MEEKTKDPWLFILPNNPGDVVMGLQALKIISEQAPQIEIHFFVDIECQDLLTGLDFIAKIWVLPRKKIHEIAFKEGEDSAFNLLFFELNELFNFHFSHSINWFQGKYGYWLQALVKAKIKKGPIVNSNGELILADSPTRLLHSIPAERTADRQHCIEHYLKIAGFSTNDLPRTQIWMAARDHKVCIQLGSAWRGKEWPLLNWLFTIEKLLENKEQIRLIGSPQEQNLAQKVIHFFNHSNDIENQVGETTLADLPILIAKSKILLTGDTLAMHLAAASGTPILALFGPSSFVETGPYQNQAQVLSNSLLPSFDFNLQDEMKDICPTDVLACFLGFQTQVPLYESYRDLHSGVLKWLNTRTGIALQPFFDLPEIHAELHNQYNLLKIFLKQPSLELLQEIEANEKIIEAKTKNSLYFEEYRFALNALDFEVPSTYYTERLKMVSNLLILLESTSKERTTQLSN